MKKFLALCLATIIVGSVLFCAGCTPNPTESRWVKTEWDIGWQLYGMWVDGNGEVTEEIAFTISGRAVYDSANDGYSELEMGIKWPDNFRFASGASNDFQPTALVKNEQEMFFIGMLLCEDTETGNIVPADFGIAPQQEYFLIYWEGVPGYLIASTNPNTDRAEIEAFFSNMMTDERFS